ncbi:MAG: Y-family DNA polymerase [bacterium]
MLWLCLRFPLLPLEVFHRVSDDQSGRRATAVIDGQRVLLADGLAARQGVKPGQSLTTAYALCPTLKAETRSRHAERRALTHLAYSCYQFTPTITLDSDDCLLLEIQGSLKLFKGLGNLLVQIQSSICDQGYRFRFGLADTPKAAQLLSYGSMDLPRYINFETGDIQDSALFQRTLEATPLTLLRITEKKLQALQRAGLHCLGDVLRLPTAAVGKRCGEDLLVYLQQLTGERADPQVSIQLPTTFNGEVFFDDVVENSEALIFPMRRLLHGFCGFLRGRQLQCSRLAWQLCHAGGHREMLTLSLARPQSDISHFLELTRLKLDQLNLKQPLEGIALRSENLHAAIYRGGVLFETPDQQVDHRENFRLLLDKLHTRLGRNAVDQLILADSHIPETASRLIGCSYSTQASPAKYPPRKPVPEGPVETVVAKSTVPERPVRPPWLLSQPESLRSHNDEIFWRGQPLAILRGPERIEVKACQQTVLRDYFVARTDNHRVCWIFRERDTRRWFLHGLFA